MVKCNWGCAFYSSVLSRLLSSPRVLSMSSPFYPVLLISFVPSPFLLLFLEVLHVSKDHQKTGKPNDLHHFPLYRFNAWSLGETRFLLNDCDGTFLGRTTPLAPCLLIIPGRCSFPLWNQEPRYRFRSVWTNNQDAKEKNKGQICNGPSMFSVTKWQRKERSWFWTWFIRLFFPSLVTNTASVLLIP